MALVAASQKYSCVPCRPERVLFWFIIKLQIIIDHNVLFVIEKIVLLQRYTMCIHQEVFSSKYNLKKVKKDHK